MYPLHYLEIFIIHPFPDYYSSLQKESSQDSIPQSCQLGLSPVLFLHCSKCCCAWFSQHPREKGNPNSSESCRFDHFQSSMIQTFLVELLHNKHPLQHQEYIYIYTTASVIYNIQYVTPKPWLTLLGSEELVCYCLSSVGMFHRGKKTQEDAYPSKNTAEGKSL